MINSKKLIKIFLLILVFLIGGYLLKAPSYPGSFEAVDNTKKIQTGVKQDFSGATLVNLDDDADSEIFISGNGSSNLLLKRVKDNLFPLTYS